MASSFSCGFLSDFYALLAISVVSAPPALAAGRATQAWRCQWSPALLIASGCVAHDRAASPVAGSTLFDFIVPEDGKFLLKPPPLPLCGSPAAGMCDLIVWHTEIYTTTAELALSDSAFVTATAAKEAALIAEGVAKGRRNATRRRHNTAWSSYLELHVQATADHGAKLDDGKGKEPAILVVAGKGKEPANPVMAGKGKEPSLFLPGSDDKLGGNGGDGDSEESDEGSDEDEDEDMVAQDLDMDLS